MHFHACVRTLNSPPCPSPPLQARTDISPALEGLQELLMDIPESPVASGSVTSPRRTLGRDISLKKVIQTAYSSAMHDPALQSTFKQLDAAELARQQQALRHLAFEIDEEEGQVRRGQAC